MLNKPKFSQLWHYCLFISTSTSLLLTTALLTKPYLKYHRNKTQIVQLQQHQQILNQNYTQCLLAKKHYHHLSQKHSKLIHNENQSMEQLIIKLNQKNYQIIHFEQNTPHTQKNLAAYTLTLAASWQQFIHLFNRLEENWPVLNIKQVTLSTDKPNNNLRAEIQFEEEKHRA